MTRLAHDPTLVQGAFSVILAPDATLRVACLWRRRVNGWMAGLRPVAVFIAVTSSAGGCPVYENRQSLFGWSEGRYCMLKLGVGGAWKVQ